MSFPFIPVIFAIRAFLREHDTSHPDCHKIEPEMGEETCMDASAMNVVSRYRIEYGTVSKIPS